MKPRGSVRKNDTKATRKEAAATSKRARPVAADLHAAIRAAGGREGPMPEWIEPQLATFIEEPPDDDRWLHEIKFDGYRILAFLDHGRCRLLTRRGIDWSERFRELCESLRRLPLENAVLDGELVALRPNGASSFEELQQRLSDKQTAGLVYFAFDLLHCEGCDLRPIPLEVRKQLLAHVLETAPSNIRYVDHLVGKGSQFLEVCRDHLLEGVVSKRRDAPYRSGRSALWLKTKCTNCDDFVVVGYTLPQGQRAEIGALVIGQYNTKGELAYAGKVGTGFSDHALRTLRELLRPLEQPKTPIQVAPPGKLERGIRWVQPAIMVQVAYTNRTQEGILRHAVFRGVREDMSDRLPRDCEPSRVRVRSAPLNDGSSEFSVDEQQQLASVRLSNPEKVLYPERNITKLDLARYYVSVADWILPQIKNRPVSLVRCPEGQQGSRFFQRHAVAGTPSAIGRVAVGAAEYLVIRDLAGLLSTVQMGVLELHTWGCRADRADRPDRLTFDLDPGPDITCKAIVGVARDVREFLSELDLISFVKTTGGRGLHVVVPIERRYGWDEAKKFAAAAAKSLARRRPELLTTVVHKASRVGRIYIDVLRNGSGSTTIAAYSPRAYPDAPVSTPLSWDELNTLRDPATLRVDTLVHRLSRLASDPWSEMEELRQTIRASARRAVGMK